MGIASRLQETFYRVTGRTELAEVLRQERATVEHLQESISDLENRMREPGWLHLTSQAEQEFSREGLRQITAVNRVMALKNPLIKRGLALRTAYVWGQGVEISARDEDVNTLVQEFLDDPGNRQSLTGAQAREENERALDTDGNLFWALFTNPRTGRVQARSIPWDEIADIITNPEDCSEAWYYKRVWHETSTGPISSGYTSRQRTVYYPALGYRPKTKPLRVKDGLGEVAEVMWDAPVHHMKVGGLKSWKFGLGVAYAAIDWAQAYKEFLTDWARLIKALSRFAWRLTSKGSKQAAAKTRIAAGAATDRITGEPQFAGATAMLTPDMALEAIPKSGATIDSESGRPLAAMVAAALDVPVTMLLGDPGTTGARATAETLDTPTERTMELRREAWTETLRAILSYVVAASVRAPQGVLKGTVERDDFGRETVTLSGDTVDTVDIGWQDIDDIDVGVLVDAIVKADGTGYMPPLRIVRLLLEALGVRNVDEILAELTDPDGNFLPPEGAAGAAGQVAVDAFRRGEDPAGSLGYTSPEDKPAGVDDTSDPKPGGVCGAPLSDGGNCTRKAGWGTDHPGTGPCQDHGG